VDPQGHHPQKGAGGNALYQPVCYQWFLPLVQVFEAQGPVCDERGIVAENGDEEKEQQPFGYR
jgi:hypothetical protein